MQNIHWKDYLGQQFAKTDCPHTRILKRNLLSIIGREEEVKSFADYNIDFKPPSSGEKDYTQLLDRNLIKNLIAAVYLANSHYLERDILHSEEHLNITISPGIKIAYCDHIHGIPYSSDIGLPLGDCLKKGFSDLVLPLYKDRLLSASLLESVQSYDSFVKFMSKLDAETRHFVHNNRQLDKGVSLSCILQRSELVITETIDDARHLDNAYIVDYDKEFCPDIDPYINDIQLLDGQKNGHHGAHYLLRHLSDNHEKRRMQLYWLSSLPLRGRLHNDKTSRLRAHLNGLFQTSGFYAAMRDDIAGLDAIEKYHMLTSRLPFNDGIDTLINFYSGKRPQVNSPEKIIDSIMRAREIALTDVPYEPDVPISIGSRTIARFASQLDYVALRLVTSPPEDLYEEAKDYT